MGIWYTEILFARDALEILRFGKGAFSGSGTMGRVLLTSTQFCLDLEYFSRVLHRGRPSPADKRARPASFVSIEIEDVIYAGLQSLRALALLLLSACFRP